MQFSSLQRVFQAIRDIAARSSSAKRAAIYAIRGDRDNALRAAHLANDKGPDVEAMRKTIGLPAQPQT